jgi:hypothetical protein
LKGQHWLKWHSYIIFVSQSPHFCSKMPDMNDKKTVEDFINKSEAHW